MDARGQQIFSSLIIVATLFVGFGVPSHCVADAGDDQYAVAASHYAAKRWELAEQEFSQLVDQFVEHRRISDSLFFSGESFMQLKRYNDAISRFDRMLAHEPDHRYAKQAMFRRGEAAYLAGNTATAEEHLQTFLDRFESDTLATYAVPYLAATKLKLNKQDHAESLYEQATTRFPDGPFAPESWLRLGILRFNRGDHTAAVKAFTSFQATHSDSPLLVQVRYWQGMAHSKLGDSDAAMAQFDAILSSTPTASWAEKAAAARVHILAATGSVGQVRAEAAAFRSQFPSSDLNDELLNAELRLLLSRKQYLSVIELLKPRLDENRGSDIQLHRRHQLALAYTANSQQNEAVEQFEFLVSKAEGTLLGDALLAKAAIHVDRRQHQLALPLLTRYQTMMPDGAHIGRCLAQLAIGNLVAGNTEEARRHYKTLQTNHSDAAVWLPTTLELAEISLRDGDIEWARTLFQSLTSEGHPEKYIARGVAGQAWCECLSEDVAASARSFQRLIDDFPDDPLIVDAALARARLLQKMGRREAALKTYQLITKDYSQHKSAAVALLRTAQLHAELSNLEQATNAYLTLIREYPTAAEVAEARYGLAWLHLDAAAPAMALAQFAAIYEQHKDSQFWSDATYRLAQHAYDAQDFAGAKRFATALSEVENEAERLGQALYLLGQIEVAMGQWQEADTPLLRIQEEVPNSTVRLAAEYWLAEAAYRREEFKLADERFERVAKQIGGRDESWLGMIPLRRAQLLARDKQWTEAAEIAALIKIDYPEFSQIYEADYLLGRCHAALAEFDKARAAYQRVTTAGQGKGGRTETAAMAQWMIGESYLHQKNHESAIRAYLRVPPLYAYPRWQAAALLQAGKCLEYQTEWAKAVQLYERVQAEFPNTIFAEEVADRLQIARQRTTAVAG